MLDKTSKIFVAGHKGMVGAGVLRALKRQGYNNILVAGRDELDLCNQHSVGEFFHSNRPAAIVLAAAKVGGIYANETYPADFLYENLMIEANLIEAAHRFKTRQLLFLGSSCIYPKFAQQPIKEAELLSGVLEATNEPYAIAKIAGIKLCESYHRQHGDDFRSLMPTNLYGPGDNFHGENSHVVPALMRRFHAAKIGQQDSVDIWGSGSPQREFMHVDDLANACVFVLQMPAEVYWQSVSNRLSHINVGVGTDISIKDLAYLISNVVGFEGEIKFDLSKPDGTPKKLMDSSVLHGMGWRSAIDLEKGLAETYDWFIQNQGALRL